METVSMLFALHELEFTVQAFAPNRMQMHAVNHSKGEPHEQNRNILEEASRIVRGNILPIEDLNPDNFDALFIPGGFGIAKNFSDYVSKAQDFKVEEDVFKAIRSFFSNKKFVAASCIAPLIVAKVIPESTVTLGKQGENWPYPDAIENALKIQAKLEYVDQD